MNKQSVTQKKQKIKKKLARKLEVPRDPISAIIETELRCADVVCCARDEQHPFMRSIWLQMRQRKTAGIGQVPASMEAISGHLSAGAQMAGIASGGKRGAFCCGTSGFHELVPEDVNLPYVSHDITGLEGYGSRSAGFSLVAKNAQESADFTLIAHHVAEMALSHGRVMSPNVRMGLKYDLIDELILSDIESYLGRAQDLIESCTVRQKQVYGDERRRIPYRDPMEKMRGIWPNQDEIIQLVETAFAEFSAITKRRYQLIESTDLDGADWVLVMSSQDYDLAKQHLDRINGQCKGRVGLVRPVLTHPYPRLQMAEGLERKQVLVVERSGSNPFPGSHLQEIQLSLAEAMSAGSGINAASSPVADPQERVVRAVDPTAVPETDQPRTWPRLQACRHHAGRLDIEALARLVADMEERRSTGQWVGFTVSGDSEEQDEAEPDGYALTYSAPASLIEGRRLAESLLHYFGFRCTVRQVAPNQVSLTWGDPDGRKKQDPGADLVIYNHRSTLAMAQSIKNLRRDGTLLYCRNADQEHDIWQQLPTDAQSEIRDREIRLYSWVNKPEDKPRVPGGWTVATLLGGFVESARHETRSGLNKGLLHSALKVISSNGDLSALKEIEAAVARIQWIDYNDLPDTTAERGTSPVSLRLERSVEPNRSKDKSKALLRDLFTFHLTGDRRSLAIDEEGQAGLRSVHHDHFVHQFAPDPGAVEVPTNTNEVLSQVAQTWKGSYQANAQGYLTKLDDLVVRLSDRMGLDSGEAPETSGLAASFGASFAGDLDLDTFSRITSKSGTAEEVSEERLERIKHALEIIRSLRSLLEFENSTALNLNMSTGWAEGLGRFKAFMHDILLFFKAVQIAELEVENKYQSESHDPYFAAFGMENMTHEQAAICPPYLLSCDSNHLDETDRATIMEVLNSGLPLKLVLLLDEICAPAESVFEAVSFKTWTLELAGLAAAQNRAFFMQTTAENVLAGNDDIAKGLTFLGPAFFCIFCGHNKNFPGLDPVSLSAMARASRAIPSFIYDPDSAGQWPDRFDLSQNPELQSDYPVHHIEYINADEKTDTLSLPYGFLDYLFSDLRFRDHFVSLTQKQWHSALKPIGQYLALSPADRRSKIPYLWAAAPDSSLHRVVPTIDLATAAMKVDADWRILKQMSGRDNAATQALLEMEKSKWLAAKDQEIQELLQKNQAALEQVSATATSEVIANIASGLLNLGAGVPNLPKSPVPVAKKPTPDAGPALPADPQAPEARQVEEKEPFEKEEAESDEDESEPEGAYIETLRCTTCNECTDLNSRMFAYDENKQAYIKDATAGTFRQLVEAAEKCPVGIIHPGTPLNPDEPGLEDLRKRAEPFA